MVVFSVLIAFKTNLNIIKKSIETSKTHSQWLCYMIKLILRTSRVLFDLLQKRIGNVALNTKNEMK